MLPANAKKRHLVVEERLGKLKEWAESAAVNQAISGSGEVGFVTNGVAFQYVREAFPLAPVLKLGMTYPLPEKKIRAFAASVKKLAIVEELDGFIEEQVKAMGIHVHFGMDAFTP